MSRLTPDSYSYFICDRRVQRTYPTSHLKSLSRVGLWSRPGLERDFCRCFRRSCFLGWRSTLPARNIRRLKSCDSSYVTSRRRYLELIKPVMPSFTRLCQVLQRGSWPISVVENIDWSGWGITLGMYVGRYVQYVCMYVWWSGGIGWDRAWLNGHSRLNGQDKALTRLWSEAKASG